MGGDGSRVRERPCCGSEDGGGGPGVKESRCPLKAGKDRGKASPLKPPGESAAQWTPGLKQSETTLGF